MIGNRFLMPIPTIAQEGDGILDGGNTLEIIKSSK